MNLDIVRVIVFFFNLNMVFYIGWDKMEFWRVSDDSLWKSP